MPFPPWTCVLPLLTRQLTGKHAGMAEAPSSGGGVERGESGNHGGLNGGKGVATGALSGVVGLATLAVPWGG